VTRGFTLEAAGILSVMRHVIRQEFEGDEAAELDVFGLVDDTHATATLLLNDPVVGNGLLSIE
jgi:hypothetical protein